MRISSLRLSRVSGVPFYRQLADQLAARIRAGSLAAGTPLPSIRDLAAELVVSVITVKGAYQFLEAEGLIESQQGRGTFVAHGLPVPSPKDRTRQLSDQFEQAAEYAQMLGMVQADALQIAITAVGKVYGKEMK